MTDYNTDEAVKPKSKSFKIIFIILGVSILAVVGLIIFLLVGGIPTTVFEDNPPSQEISVSLGENEEIKFNISEEEHKVKVDSISQNSVDITVQSSPISATLSPGEIQKFDLDSNGTYDISIKLINITNEKANLYLKEIKEIICFENWSCTDWTNCTNESKTRVCTDLSNCGTGKGKPAETQNCGGTETTETIGLNCSEQPETKIDCFIISAATCHPANLTYGFTMNRLGWVQTSSYYYKINGFDSGKCELYQKVLSSSGVYSDVKKQSLLEEGETEEGIAVLEEEKNEELANYTGKSGLCRYSTYDLKNMLTELKQDGTILPIENPETYECVGTLYGTNYSI